MSISKRVTEAFEKMMNNDYEGALFAICAAVEQTAKKEGRPKGKKGFKDFIKQNMHIITGIGIGHPVRGLSIHCTHSELPKTADGVSPIEDILYHVVRCGLYHEAALPESLVLTEHVLAPERNGSMKLPGNLAAGLIAAVVASPANKDEFTKPHFYFDTYAGPIPLATLWGQKLTLTKDLIAADEKRRAES